MATGDGSPSTRSEIARLITEKPRAQIVRMTPKLAKRILNECNVRNRACSNRRVSMYEDEMRAGRWMFTGEAIKISREGVLLDGQHRLYGLLDAGVTLPLLVITGLDPKAQEVMDQGMPRSLGDAFKLRGEQYPNELAAAVRIIAHYYRDGAPFQFGSNPGMSHGYALKLFDRGANREQLIAALEFVRARHITGWNSLSMMTGLHFLLEAADEEKARSFTETLLTGEGPVEAALAVREHLRSEYVHASVERPRAHVKARTVYIVQAWNAGDGPPPEFRWAQRDGFPGIAGLST